METVTGPAMEQVHAAQNALRQGAPDKVSLTGYLLLAITAFLYALGDYLGLSQRSDNFTIFIVHYLIAVAYVVILIVNRSYGIRKSWRREHIHKTVILLNLFLVSAYALNRELPVFHDSVSWYCVYLILSSAALLSHPYLKKLPIAFTYLQRFLTGSALVMYLYMTIYVANFYILGTIGTILFGIGAHIFVPLLLLVATIRSIILEHKKSRVGITAVVSGVLATIVLASAFITAWNVRVKAIDRIANQSVIHADTELPVWIKVAQNIKTDWLSQRILKSSIVYTVSNNHFQWDLFPSGSSWDEKHRHDPLVFLASATGNSSLSFDDRRNILKAMTDSRHIAEDRLWSGANLTTSYIVTDVDLYPELRIAYTEHYLNVRNNNLNNNRWWGNSEEAIYTFQLPEGSVVTSLSLWVNGKEEKAILTSKQKAKEAYNTIVGREKRDPSVVHWQEGNAVSVRVFPCTPQEERKFKIGITSPLCVEGDKAHYRNVTFRGPDPDGANQTTRVRIIGASRQIDLGSEFKKNIKGDFIREGGYDEALKLSMVSGPIPAHRFSFDGFTYSLASSTPVMKPVEFNSVYLDINNSWTSEEIEALRFVLDKYKVYAYLENEFVEISGENWREVAVALRENDFSLFPFHHIKKTENTLVISKGKEFSPNLDDFKSSKFAEGIGQYFAAGKQVYLFNLDGGISPYIRSLKELRAFRFAHGTTSDLADFLVKKSFPIIEESAQQVALHESNMIIQKTPTKEGDQRNTAPDHLARLFAYNDIMRKIGGTFFKDSFVNEDLVAEAATAYVVSPVSSLIVLETKEDYDRFGIKEVENSLKNATKNSSGAVPEPHEWALIIVFLAFILFQVLRERKIQFISAWFKP